MVGAQYNFYNLSYIVNYITLDLMLSYKYDNVTILYTRVEEFCAYFPRMQLPHLKTYFFNYYLKRASMEDDNQQLVL